jgi:hypothetical protein
MSAKGSGLDVPDVENDANRFLEIVVVLKSFGMTITISSC